MDWTPQLTVASLALVVSVATFLRTRGLLARADVTDGVMRWHALYDQQGIAGASARLRAQGSSLSGSNQWQFSNSATADQAQLDFGSVVAMLDAARPVVAVADRHKRTWKRLGPHMLDRLQKLASALDELRWEASKCESTWGALTINDQLERDFKEAIRELNTYRAVSKYINNEKGLVYDHPDPYESNRAARAARPPC